MWGAIPFAVSYLYRGQAEYYRPLLPSIARGLQSSDLGQLYRNSISDQSKLILRLAQSWWFSRELTRHPISSHACDLGLDLDPIGLAQHYGIPTGYLDLTDDFNVGAFFATCRPNGRGWKPVSTGVGIMYRVGLREISHPFRQYIPLGPQKLPRPTEQCAWITELPLCHGFEGWPGVYILKFNHDRRVAEHFYKMFAGGELLFPPDPLAYVAEEIFSCGELPRDILEAAIDSFAKDPNGVRTEDIPALRKEISSLVTLTGGRKLLTDQHISSLITDSEWCQRMLAKVKVNWRAVRREPIR